MASAQKNASDFAGSKFITRALLLASKYEEAKLLADSISESLVAAFEGVLDLYIRRLGSPLVLNVAFPQAQEVSDGEFQVFLEDVLHAFILYTQLAYPDVDEKSADALCTLVQSVDTLDARACREFVTFLFWDTFSLEGDALRNHVDRFMDLLKAGYFKRLRSVEEELATIGSPIDYLFAHHPEILAIRGVDELERLLQKRPSLLAALSMAIRDVASELPNARFVLVYTPSASGPKLSLRNALDKECEECQKSFISALSKYIFVPEGSL